MADVLLLARYMACPLLCVVGVSVLKRLVRVKYIVAWVVAAESFYLKSLSIGGNGGEADRVFFLPGRL